MLSKCFLNTQFCTSVKTIPLLGKNVNTIFFYLLLRITPTHSSYIKIWATQSFVTFKTQWKMNLIRILFISRNFLLEMISKILLYTQKNTFSCEKVYCSFDLTLQLYYQFFKSWKLQITWKRSCVTQMIKIYILQRILFRLTSWFSLQDSAYSANKIRPKASGCAFKKV